jgi:hypothetical protein
MGKRKNGKAETNKDGIAINLIIKWKVKVSPRKVLLAVSIVLVVGVALFSGVSPALANLIKQLLALW